VTDQILVEFPAHNLAAVSECTLNWEIDELVPLSSTTTYISSSVFIISCLP